MEHSESIKELAEALAKAQGELKPIPKTGKGNYGKYAELAPTLEHVLPVLSEQGLSVTQMPVLLDDGTTGMVTLLMHKSGEWIGSTYPVRMQQQTPQAQGSAITYARRYALMAVVGIAGDDDDGQAATDGNNPERSSRRQQPQAAKLDTRTALANAMKLLKDKGFGKEEALHIMAAVAGVDDPSKLTARNLVGVIKVVEQAPTEELAVYLPSTTDAPLDDVQVEQPAPAPVEPPFKPAKTLDVQTIKTYLRGHGLNTEEEFAESLRNKYGVKDPSRISDDEASRVLVLMRAKTSAGEGGEQGQIV